ncbi:hypothetical protein BVRB_7g168640 [Beta vulgaris subsp. vulgaris]|nr:hypothetical protein BVRB_7g168640 [Beta vulgaris subsp. vulgaris]
MFSVLRRLLLHYSLSGINMEEGQKKNFEVFIILPS